MNGTPIRPSLHGSSPRRRVAQSLPVAVLALAGLALGGTHIPGCAGGQAPGMAAEAMKAAPAPEELHDQAPAEEKKRELPAPRPVAPPPPVDQPERAAAEPEPMPVMREEAGMALEAADWDGDDELQFAWELDDVDEDNLDRWGGGDDWGGEWGGEVVPQVVYAPVRQFPVPDYSVPYDGPRVDFRETVYWNPSVRTDANGKAEVAFYLSDGVTSFRASAEGIAAGVVARTESVVASKLPVSLAVKLPLEVTRGDRIELPVTLANDTTRPQQAHLTSAFGTAFKVLDNAIPEHLSLEPGQRVSFFYPLQVVGDGRQANHGDVRITVEASNLRDELQRTVRVVPEGFPFETSVSGALSDRAEHEFTVGNALPGTLAATVRLYPSPLSTLVSGTDAMIREPYGCFEQASSSNYPNIMILRYLETHGEADPALVERTMGHLDKGYGMLTGYESPEHGYEWFGGDPGHEALTAYGLMEFVDMGAVYDVDAGMVQRTVAWLLSRRDGKGGYQRNPRALDSFGQASEEVTNAYITWALSEAGQRDLYPEVDKVREYARTSKDAYVLALAANTLLNVEPDGKSAAGALERLLELQDEDGGFTRAEHSITRSGGIALGVETTALAAMAMMKSKSPAEMPLRKAIQWIQARNDGWGGYGSTQSTILGLRALTAFADRTRKLPAGTVIRVMLNGQEAAVITADGDESGEMVIGGLERFLHEGKNTLVLEMDADDAALAYSALVAYRSEKPASSPEAPIGIRTELAAPEVALGETVRLHAEIQNRTKEGQPMVLGRIGLPGGLTFQTWQLKELREKGIIDFYETREREVVVYFRSMAPADVKNIDLDLVASVPGHFEAPASAAYLYYTDEHKQWTNPLAIDVRR